MDLWTELWVRSRGRIGLQVPPFRWRFLIHWWAWRGYVLWPLGRKFRLWR